MKTFRTLLFAAVVAAVACTPALAAGEILLQLAGIPGESIVTGHEHEIDVLSLSFGVSQTGIRAAGGAASARRSSLSTISIQKLIDLSSPKLFLACALGTAIPSAKLTLRKTGDLPYEYLVITLQDVFVSSVSTNASEGGDAVESVSLSFSKITYQYTPLDSNGQPLPPIKVSFDVFKNREFTAQ